MNRLPENLRELESRLALRPCPDPPADLRSRLLNAVANVPLPVQHPGRWWIACRAAAAVILAINLTMTVANAVRLQRVSTMTAAPQRAAVAPASASESDDPFDALTASVRSSMTPAPHIGELSRNFFTSTGEREWASP